MKKITDTFVKYKDLIAIPIKEIKDPMVSLKDENILFGYMSEFSDMKKVLGSMIFVRKHVGERIKKAEEVLQKENKDYRLFVTYGYRSLSIQTKIFLDILSTTTTKFYENPIELYEKVHESIAVPTVGGHPTGGAIDIKIMNVKTKEFLDFGSKQYDFGSEKCYTYAKGISKTGMENRMLLRACMTKAGFAPYDGEWWHFSYGDREWAAYYKKKNALYKQLEFKN